MSMNPATTRDFLLPFVGKINSIDLFTLNSIPDRNDAWVAFTSRVATAISPPGTLQGLPMRPPPPSAGRLASFTHLRETLVRYINLVDSLASLASLEFSRGCLASCPGVTPCPTCVTTSSAPPTPTKTYADALVGSRPPSPESDAVTPDPTSTPTNPAPKKRRTRRSTRAQHPRTVVPAPSGLPLKPTSTLRPSQATGLSVSKPVRLVVRFGGSPPATLCGLSQPDLFSLAQSGTKDLGVLGVQWNKANNLILSFPTGTPHSAVLDACPAIRTAFGAPESTVMSIDTPWTKLMVSSVPARPAPGAPVHSEANLTSSFLLNPALKNITFTRQPRWLRNPANITGAHSSFVFSFEDPNQVISRSLLKSTIFIFGAPVAIKKWRQIPPVAS